MTAERDHTAEVPVQATPENISFLLDSTAPAAERTASSSPATSTPVPHPGDTGASTPARDPNMHPSVQHVVKTLSRLGAGGKVVVLPDAAATAAAAAALLGCEVGAIANSLIFDADGSPLLVLTSGAHRVDVKKIATLVGVKKVKRATPEMVRAATGHPIGGVSPVGHPAPVRTLVDKWLEKYDVVWAAAGHPHSVFPSTYEELLRITEGTAAEVE